MNTAELAAKTGFTPLHLAGERPVTGVYCCDLLSIVMGRAPAGCAWVTVMGNLNAVAVAVLADVACIVVAEDMPVDGEVLARCEQEGITLFATDRPVYEAAAAVGRLL